MFKICNDHDNDGGCGSGVSGDDNVDIDDEVNIDDDV